MKDVNAYVAEVLERAHSKEELNQIVFDVHSFLEVVGYKSVAKNGDTAQKRKILIASELKNISSTPLKIYFESLLKKEDLWLFEPGHFTDFEAALKENALETAAISLTIPVELKADDLEEITRELSVKLGKKVVIDYTVDKSILGGAIIKKGNYIMDFSLKSKLSALGSDWKKSISRSKNHD